MNCSTTRIYRDLTNSSTKLIGGGAQVFWLQILLQTLKPIISHHESASVSHNAKSEAIFTHSALVHQCVRSSRVHIFCRKLFFTFFFLPLYRVIKKVKARCIKQKSERLWTGLCWAYRGGIYLIPLIVGQRKADISRSLSVSGILLERGDVVVVVLGGDSGWGGMDLGGWGGLSEVSHVPSDPPLPLSLPKHSLFGT